MAVFVGGTGSANQLDDYEEGTFTPIMHSINGGAANGSYSQQSGKYKKVGSMVHIRFDITWSGWSNASGTPQVDNLPFINVGQSSTGGYGAPQFRDLSGLGNDIKLYGNSSYCKHNENLIALFKFNSSGIEGSATVNTNGRITGEAVFYTE